MVIAGACRKRVAGLADEGSSCWWRSSAIVARASAGADAPNDGRTGRAKAISTAARQLALTTTSIRFATARFWA